MTRLGSRQTHRIEGCNVKHTEQKGAPSNTPYRKVHRQTHRTERCTVKHTVQKGAPSNIPYRKSDLSPSITCMQEAVARATRGHSGTCHEGSRILELREYTVVETRVTLKVVRTRLKLVLINSKIENAALRSLPWTSSCKLHFKRESILQPLTSNSSADYRVPCPPLTPLSHDARLRCN